MFGWSIVNDTVSFVDAVKTCAPIDWDSLRVGVPPPKASVPRLPFTKVSATVSLRVMSDKWQLLKVAGRSPVRETSATVQFLN